MRILRFGAEGGVHGDAVIGLETGDCVIESAVLQEVAELFVAGLGEGGEGKSK